MQNLLQSQEMKCSQHPEEIRDNLNLVSCVQGDKQLICKRCNYSNLNLLKLNQLDEFLKKFNNETKFVTTEFRNTNMLLFVAKKIQEQIPKIENELNDIKRSLEIKQKMNDSIQNLLTNFDYKKLQALLQYIKENKITQDKIEENRCMFESEIQKDKKCSQSLNILIKANDEINSILIQEPVIIRNLQPGINNQKPIVINPQPIILNRQTGINIQPVIMNQKPIGINQRQTEELPTGLNQQPVIMNQVPIGNNQQQQQIYLNQQPIGNNQQQQQIYMNQQPIGINERQTKEINRPTGLNPQPVIMNQVPIGNNQQQQQINMNQQPIGNNQNQLGSNQQLIGIDQKLRETKVSEVFLFDKQVEQDFDKKIEVYDIQLNVTGLFLAIGNSKIISSKIGYDDCYAQIWEIEGGVLRKTQSLYGHKREVKTLFFNDEDTLFTGSIDSTIKIWVKQDNENNWKLNQNLENFHHLAVNRIQLCYANQIFFASGSEELIIWKKDISQNGNWVDDSIFQNNTRIIQALSFCDNGKLLIVGSDDRLIQILEYSYKKWQLKYKEVQDNKIMQIISTYDWDFISFLIDGQYTYWKFQYINNDLKWTTKKENKMEGEITKLSLSLAKKLLAITYQDRKFKLFQIDFYGQLSEKPLGNIEGDLMIMSYLSPPKQDVGITGFGLRQSKFAMINKVKGKLQIFLERKGLK